VTASEFSRLSQYPWACISIIQQDGRLVYGSSIEEVNRASDQLFVEFRTPPLAVNQKYTVRILGFTDEPEDSFSCPASDPAGILWAQLGRVDYWAGPKPGTPRIPVVFYESIASILINNGDTYTKSSTVSLKLAAKDADQMILYPTSDCSGTPLSDLGSSFQSFLPSVPLASGDGMKSLSAKFGKSGSSDFTCVTDAIELDSTAPTVSAVGAPVKVKNSPLTIALTFSEPIFDFTVSSLQATRATVSQVEGNEKDFLVTITPTGTGTVTLGLHPDSIARDQAGNKLVALGNPSSSGNAISVLIDGDPPSGNTVSFGSYSAGIATLHLSSSSTDTADMFIANTEMDCSTGTEWESFRGTKQWNPVFLGTSAVVYAKFRDDVGNESSCVTTNPPLVVPTVPPSIKINNDANSTNNSPLNITI
ncbi:MAG: hypothetical protein EBZ49_17445, partial [Proteobacteria bacterium]|nr:hypothetical protein [Pseudomonadota bacterium]